MGKSEEKTNSSEVTVLHTLLTNVGQARRVFTSEVSDV